MAKETELERLVVRLIGDAEQYKRMIDESKRATKDAANSVVRAGKRIEGVQQTIKGLGRRFSQAGMAMKSFGKKISLYVTAPLTAMGGLATRESVKFSDSLAKIRGLVGLSSEAVQGFRKDILSLATEVGKAPEELSEAMFFITSAGLRGDAALEALTVSAKAAASGMGQTKSVADAVTNAMNAYGQETMSATRSTEILTAAIRAGKADAASFAPQLGQLLPMANHLGVGFDEVAGSIAFLTKTTGNASLAATQYKGILRALVKPPKEVRKRLEELAKSTGDVSQTQI